MTRTLVQAPPWRFVIAFIDPDNSSGKAGGTLTFLDRLAVNRSVGYVLNDAAVAAMDAPSDSPEVNILRVGGGKPFLWFGNRFLFGFRREGAGSTPRPSSYDIGAPWVIRYAGIIDQLGREAQADQGVSHITAHDPWQYWSSLPVVNDDGELPGRGGWRPLDASGNPLRGDQIVVKLLTNTLTYMQAIQVGSTLYADFGQSGFYGGTIEHTSTLDITFDQGMMLGDALKKITDGGSLDIVLTPIYDLVNRPLLIVEVNVFNEAGTDNPGAIFGWDLVPRSLSGVDLLDDFTQAENVAQYYASSAKIPIPLQKDTTSIGTYGQWWRERSVTGSGSVADIESWFAALAAAEVRLRRNGKRTLTISPAPERSPVPFNEYFLGDRVPVWASRANFGIDLGPGPSSGGIDPVWTNPQRVYGMPISISDDEVETVDRMLLTQPDFTG